MIDNILEFMLFFYEIFVNYNNFNRELIYNFNITLKR